MIATLAVAASLLGASDLAIYSHNIRVDYRGEGWARRKGPIIEALGEGDFDLILIQEATEAQIPAFYKALPGRHAVVGERSDGHRGQGFYEYNPIFYRADRFALVRGGSFWVADDPTEPGATLSGTKAHGRVVTWARLRSRRDGADLLVVNLHIHGQRVADALDLIVDRLKPEAQDAAVVLAGDLNAEPDEPGLSWLAAQGFKDARGVARSVTGPAATVIHGGQFTHDSGGDFTATGAKSVTLDYVFACGFKAPLRHETLELPLEAGGARASDHYALAVRYPSGWRPCR